MSKFDGESEEPFDGRAVKMGENKYPHIAVATFADMNLNGFRDLRETVTQAWRRLGLLNHNESINHDRYVSCVTGSVRDLVAEGFISDKIGDTYIRNASEPLPDWVR